MDNSSFEKSAAIIFYPDKIIIETRNKKDNYTWYSSGKLTIFPINASAGMLGEGIINHLNQSEIKGIEMKEMKELRNLFRKKGKFKSEKSTMEDAKYVSIYSDKNMIRFEPKKNKTSQQLFYNMPESISEFAVKNLDSIKIGKYARDSAAKCVFI